MEDKRLYSLDKYRWLLPCQGNMRVEGIVFAVEEMLEQFRIDGTLDQLRNIACLPGIVKRALCMPDAHQGYGFPIGGVAAFDKDNGIISPGGVGYDINCGVRLLRSNLLSNELNYSQIILLADTLANNIPAGLGKESKLRLDKKDIYKILVEGAGWAINRGFGEKSDLEFCESKGIFRDANPEVVSERAINRGRVQAGSLGAGNHFLEIAWVEKIFDFPAAYAFRLFPGQLVIWLHSGSRGLGHQVCDDYLKILGKDKGAIHINDRQLVAVQPNSNNGVAYLGAMAGAANFAFNNRQVLTHLIRENISHVLELSQEDLGLDLVYDIAHNIVKLESHKVEGRDIDLWVHRKGATRAFGPGYSELPLVYMEVGQPVLVPGDMGRFSYILKGTKQSERETFASSAHGAGRLISRYQAKKKSIGRKLIEEMERRQVVVRARSLRTLAEEMPDSYKDITQVIEIMHNLGIATMVARTRPLIVVKG